MIPRSLRILFWVLLLASVAMAVVLMRLRETAADRLAARNAESSASEEALPQPAAKETVTLFEASDGDGSIAPVVRQLALPQETGARARVLLRQLFADYAAPGSRHALAPGPGVEEVFFMPATSNQTPDRTQAAAPGQTAIVDFTRAFAENHPSGIEPETLTLLSIIETLHQNFPAVEQVRFLVDGAPRENLAGHADLTRTYLAGSIPAEP